MAKRKMTVAQFLEAQINACDRSQGEIAELVGFAKPTMVSMVKLGKAKVPLDKARALAKAIGVDDRDFFLRCLEEYLPVIYEEIQSMQESQPLLTDNEIDIINKIRAKRPENPYVHTPEQHAALDKFIDTLTGE